MNNVSLGRLSQPVLRFGNRENNLPPATLEGKTFSRSREFFLQECGVDPVGEPFATFAASHLNMALKMAFGQNNFAALASDDDAVLQLTFDMQYLPRLNEVLNSTMFDPSGDRWALVPSDATQALNTQPWILRETLKDPTTQAVTQRREIPVFIQFGIIS